MMGRSILLTILLTSLTLTVAAQVTTIQTTLFFDERRIPAAQRESLHRILLAGNAAFLERRFDDAILLYEQGSAEAPLLSVFWVNKSVALYHRGATDYNKYNRAPDQVERTAKIEKARQDLSQAIDAATRGLGLLSNAPGANASPEIKKYYAEERLRALFARAEPLRIYVSTFDARQALDAVAAYREFVEAATDPTLKAGAQMHYARLLLETNAADSAIEEFKKILTSDQNHLEALLGAGLALTNLGYAANDTVKLQEGINYLQWFIERAPEAHQLKASASEALMYLNQGQRDEQSDQAKVLGANSETNQQALSEEVISGKVISKPAPSYPLIGKAARATGPVYVKIVVDEQGNVISAWANSGHPLLRAAAAGAARQARFTLTTLGGKAVKVSGVITYNFILQGAGEFSNKK